MLHLLYSTARARQAEDATESRKALTAEVIAAEDDDGRQRREEQVAKEEGIREKLREETDAFYCEVRSYLHYVGYFRLRRLL